MIAEVKGWRDGEKEGRELGERLGKGEGNWGEDSLDLGGEVRANEDIPLLER